jgi:NAD-specific glutamate dehydrogenase
MLKQTDHNDTNPLTAVFELIQKRLPADVADLATNFTKNFYERVSAEDLAERSTQDLYGAALSHWHFASRFTPGASRLRVLQPATGRTWLAINAHDHRNHQPGHALPR